MYKIPKKEIGESGAWRNAPEWTTKRTTKETFCIILYCTSLDK